MGMKFYDYPINGIDVSQYNGAIDWNKTKATFAVIRVGHGRVTDKTFSTNWAYAKGKIARLPYWYMDYYSNHDKTTTAYGITDVAWGKIQAEKCWELLKNDFEGTLFLDIENASVADATIHQVKERVLIIAQSFLDAFDKLSGKTTGIYCSVSLCSYFPSNIQSRPLWVAWYTDTQTIDSVKKAVAKQGWTGKILMWQYASDGDVDDDGQGDGKKLGMQYSFLDLNIWMLSQSEWKEFMGTTNILLDIIPLSQSDARWKSEKLGTSTSTIGGYGCLITSVSMMLNHFGFDTDPSRLNKLLVANNGYSSGNLFVWGSLYSLFPGVGGYIRHTGFPKDKIDAQLSANRPVIVHVDYVPSTAAIDEHWVLIVGKVDGDYIINDPKDGKQLKLKDRYTNGVFHVCTYNYTVQEQENIMYRVKVLIKDLLIRSGPGQLYPVVKRYASGEYNILEEKNNYGRIGVGQWISLDPSLVEKLDSSGLSESDKLNKLWEAHPELH